jgi:hypothetical protein
MLLLSLFICALSVMADDSNCPSHQCYWIDEPGANCGMKDINKLIATVIIPASGYQENGDEAEPIPTDIFKSTTIQCCGNIHRCCDYAPCENTGCAQVPDSCRDNPGPQTSCSDVAVSYLARFGSAEDFGDAPDSYHTLLANNGARHKIVDEVHLGQLINAEPDGAPTPRADGDDKNNIADEDGVVFIHASSVKNQHA